MKENSLVKWILKVCGTYLTWSCPRSGAHSILIFRLRMVSRSYCFCQEVSGDKFPYTRPTYLPNLEGFVMWSLTNWSLRRWTHMYKLRLINAYSLGVPKHAARDPNFLLTNTYPILHNKMSAPSWCHGSERLLSAMCNVLNLSCRWD